MRYWHVYFCFIFLFWVDCAVIFFMRYRYLLRDINIFFMRYQHVCLCIIAILTFLLCDIDPYNFFTLVLWFLDFCKKVPICIFLYFLQYQHFLYVILRRGFFFLTLIPYFLDFWKKFIPYGSKKYDSVLYLSPSNSRTNCVRT